MLERDLFGLVRVQFWIQPMRSALWRQHKRAPVVDVQHPCATAGRDDHEAVTVSRLSHTAALELADRCKKAGLVRLQLNKVGLLDLRVRLVLLPFIPAISRHDRTASLPNVAEELRGGCGLHPGVDRWRPFPLRPERGVSPLDRLHA